MEEGSVNGKFSLVYLGAARTGEWHELVDQQSGNSGFQALRNAGQIFDVFLISVWPCGYEILKDLQMIRQCLHARLLKYRVVVDYC